MAQRKPAEVNAFLSRPDTAFPVVLLYGPDLGLVAERAERLADASGVDRKDPFASVSFSADELERNIGRLFDEAGTVSLFGGKRLIRVRGAGAGKQLADAVADLARTPPRDVLILIEAGDLKKSSALRVNAERGHAAMALPCYQDEARSLDIMIDEELRLAQLAITKGARDMLRARLGADRLASRSEVRKLCIYAYGQETVSEEDVSAVVGDVSADALDEAVDAGAGGEVKRLPGLIDLLAGAGTQPFQLLQALLRHFQALQVMRYAVEHGGEPVSRAAERRRPHFSRRAALETALGLWTLDALAAVLRRLEAAILATRKEAGLADTIARETLLAIAVEAARLRTRSRR